MATMQSRGSDFDTRIKELHDFAVRSTSEYEYRSIDAWIMLLKNNIRTIYWYGAKPEDINFFMDDFIKIYKDKSIYDKYIVELENVINNKKTSNDESEIYSLRFNSWEEAFINMTKK